MKILHVINSLNTGGAEKLLIESIHLYTEKGIYADLLLLNGTKYPFLRDLELSKCCSIFSLGTHSIYNPINIFKIIPYLKKYDLVHVHLFPAQYWVVIAKLVSFSKIHLIFTEHNTSNRRLQNPIYRTIDKNVYKFYDRIICITKEVKEILIRHSHLPSDQFQIIENGVNLKNLKSSTPIQLFEINSILKATDKILIQVAGFRAQKDQKTLIRAMAILPEYIKLLLVGDGALRKECEALVSDLNLNQRIIFLGIRMDVPRLLKAADIVIMSSFWEGFGLAAVEGMAANKPVIATNVPGLAEVVNDAGVLFDVGNEKDLAEKILDLMNDPTKYKEVAQKCQSRAAEYDIQKMVDGYVEVYLEVMNLHS